MIEREPDSAHRHSSRRRKRGAHIPPKTRPTTQNAQSSVASRQALTPSRIQAWLSKGGTSNNIFQKLEGRQRWLKWPSYCLGCLCTYLIGPLLFIFFGFFAVSGFSFDSYRLSQAPGWLLATVVVLGIVVGGLGTGMLIVVGIPAWYFKHKRAKLNAQGISALAEIRVIHWRFVHTTRGGGRYTSGHPTDVLNIQLDLYWRHPITASPCSGRVLYEIEDNVNKNEQHIEEFCTAYHLGSQVTVLFLPTKPTYFLPLIPHRPRPYATI